MTSSERTDTLQDSAARAAIARDLDVTMMVEAAAGTGKTTSLVTRAVALLREKRCDVSQLAAITFTVKAAAQLRERLQAELERDPRGVEDAIRNLDRAFIGTTHAFCARLLRERPIEAGLDPEFEEVDQLQAALVMSDFWQRWYQGRVALGAEDVVRAREAGLTADLLRDSFLRLVDFHGDVEIASEECARPELAPVVEKIRRFVGTLRNDLPDGSAEKQDLFESMMKTLIRLERTRDLGNTLDQVDYLIAAAHESRKPTQKNWPDKARAKQYGLQYAPIGSAAKEVLRRWREYVHCLATNVLRAALDEFAKERREYAQVTFNDLLLHARNLLRDHPHVRRYFQRRFTHVLVDEFQDTDPLQAEMLFYLTGEEVEETGWTSLTPRRGSLFIVGDPKQSIYRFRRADITTYMSVRERIQQTGGTVVSLATNFRSSKPICAHVNATFETVFDSASVAEQIQAPHVDLFHSRQGGAIDGVYLLEQPGGKVDEISAAEATCIAQWIARAVHGGLTIHDGGKERPVQWSDFLLVSRTRGRLHLYAAALEEQGIPFEVTGAQRFSENRWLHAAIPLLRAVVDPSDPVRVVSFLRGPLCGAGDDELYEFVRADGRWSRLHELPAGTSPAIVDGAAILRDAREYARQLPPAAAIARTFERIGLIGRAAADAQPGTSAGNTMLALAIAREQSARGASFALVVDAIAELLEEELEVEEMNVDPALENAVQLMNLHQVKGLEAPVVFLIDPGKESDHTPTHHIDRSGERARGWFPIRKTKRNPWITEVVAQPRGWDELEVREKRFSRAEDDRLLYVAATRAKNILVVGHSRDRNGISGRWKKLARGVTEKLFGRDASERPSDVVSETGESFARAMRDLNARRDASAAPSYSVAPITRIAHGDHATLVRSEEGLGRGTSWGRVLHRLFEALLRAPEIDVRLYAESLLKDEERDAAEIDDVLRTVEAVRASALWKRVIAADEKYAEVPFALEVPARSVGIDYDGATLLHGAIDLVFREGNRWFIVDYKSDSLAGRRDALVEYYRAQVEHYVRFWSELTGADAQGGLFFVDGPEEVWL